MYRQLESRWRLIASLVWWGAMTVAFCIGLANAWHGRMIGSRWLWITCAILWLGLSLYRAGKPAVALLSGGYRGGLLDC